MSIAEVSEKDRLSALKRNKRHGPFVCIGGIGDHGKCVANFPPCSYCLNAPEDTEEIMTDTTKDGLWFASVGGNPTEVIRISGGQMFSIGCADPHDLSGVELIQMIENMPLNAQGKAKKEKAFLAAQERHFKKHGRYPSYRIFP